MEVAAGANLTGFWTSSSEPQPALSPYIETQACLWQHTVALSFLHHVAPAEGVGDLKAPQNLG